MYFKIKMNLNSSQKIELYKLGQATKYVYNVALELLAINYVDNNRIYKTHELYDLVEFRTSSSKEVSNYIFSVFTPVIRLAQKNYSEFINRHGIKPYKKEVNEFDFTIYLDKDDIVIQKDGIVVVNKALIPSIKSNDDYVLKSSNIIGIQGAKDYKNFKIHYDGSNYYFQGDRIPYKKDKTKGTLLYFNDRYFVSSSEGLQIKKLTNDDGFMNKCLVILDLENVQLSKGKLSESEQKSLEFTKKRVNYLIDSYLNKVVNEIISKDVQFICINEPAKTKLDLNLKDKIDKYLVKQARNLLFKKCMTQNIDYFVMPQRLKNLDTPKINKRLYL